MKRKNKKYDDGGTILNAGEFAQYSAWKSKLPKRLQYEGDYDLKGFWKANPGFDIKDPEQHLTDTYKLPNHPTFSNESIYFNSTNATQAGEWNRDTYIPYRKKMGDGGKVDYPLPILAPLNVTDDRTHYSPVSDRIFLNVGEFNHDPTSIHHENYHAYQHLIGVDRVPQTYPGPLRRPVEASTDESSAGYYNRRSNDIKDIDRDFLKKHPDFKFTPEGLRNDRLNDIQYQVPWTLEGEAQRYQDTGEITTMKKGGKISKKKLADGGLTTQDRDAWNKMQTNAYQQGFLGDNHNPQVGQQFMQSNGIDPSKLGAYQADMKSIDPSRLTNSGPGLSKVDNHYGNITAQQRYMNYELQHVDSKGSMTSQNFGTDRDALAMAQANIYNPKPPQWQSNSQGVPVSAAQMSQPITYNSDSGTRSQGDNWHTNEATNYSIDSVRQQQEEEMGKGGKIHIKKANVGKFTEYKKRTGKTTEEALHSKDPHVRKMANFARNASKWKHADGGEIDPTQPQQSNSNFQIGAGLTLNTAPLIQGMNALVTQGIYNPMVHAQEGNMMRQAMQSVNSANNFMGGDMLNYAQGGPVGNYITNPYMAKEMVEGGEYVQLPDGTGDVMEGDKHSAPSGGIPTNLPPESRVYSDQIKADKSFVSDITDGKMNKKMTIANIAKKYDNKKEDQRIKDSNDPITKRTATLMKGYKSDKLDQIFNYQEMTKDPEGFVNKMAMGGRVRYDNGGTKDYGSYGRPSYDNPLFNNPNAHTPLPGPVAPEYPTDGMVNLPQFANNPTGPRMDNGQFFSPDTPDGTDANLAGLGEYARNTAGPSNNDPMPIRKKSKGITFGQTAVPGFIPGAVAAVNAITDYPIYSRKYQPDYLGKQEGMNIDPALNRNLALARPAMTGNSGNASVDQARALQALGATQEADNQLYGQKFNYDSQQNYSRNAQNVQTKNQADMLNLQRMDQTWDKMTQRDSNKRAAYQAIANNAYTNSRQALLDKNKQVLAQQMTPHYHYDPSTGFSWVQDSGGNWHSVPIGQNPLGNIPVSGYKEKVKRPGGVEDTYYHKPQ